MASEKLRKYLAYYQKVLRDDPENIEARLRLAAIFREMGRKNHAVEEYSTASKLLARDGLPLEAIAACKAVLELDPTHTESQFFLARLYAHVPASAARIAQPVAGPLVAQQATTAVPRSTQDFEDDALDSVVSMIDLVQPKSSVTKTVDVLETVWNRQHDHTEAGHEAREGLDEATDSMDFETQDITGRIEGEDLTVELARIERDPDLYKTVDLQPDDILAEYDMVRERQDTLQIPRRVTQSIIAANEPTETISLGVFDMDSLELGDEDFDLPDLDDIEISDSDISERPAEPSVVNVSRHGLPEIPLFSRLSQAAFMNIVNAIEFRRFKPRDVILAPDDSSRSLFVIVHGLTRVWRSVDGHEIDLAHMGPGEFFGEFRLLTGRDGMATVSAQTHVEVFELSESEIANIAESTPEIWDVLWDFYYKRMLNNLLASHTLFRALDEEQRTALAGAFMQIEVLQNEYLLRTGDVCKNLYLLMNGEIVVEHDLGGITETLAEMREGEFFGVASTLGESPYPADVRAVRDTIVFALPSEYFRRIVDDHIEVAREVQIEMRKRRALNNQFTSGVITYAELGIVSDD